jgi:threonyl-tRNA synthetase
VTPLVAGPHLSDTAHIGAFHAFQTSAALWEWGSVNGASGSAAAAVGAAPSTLSLQRIYAVAFPKAADFKLWQMRREEAAQRSHQLIGQQQRLFFLHPASPGAPFFLPHGVRIISALKRLLQREYQQEGYLEVCGLC